MSSTMGLDIWAITARIKKYKFIIMKKKKEHNETALLAKTNLDCMKTQFLVLYPIVNKK